MSIFGGAYGTAWKSAMSEDLFNDPAVVRVIRAVLVSKGIPAQQLDDAIADVRLKCIERVRETGRPPKDVAEASAIARPIAGKHGIDEARTRIRRAKVTPGPTEAADEHADEPEAAVHPHDRERAVEALAKELSPGQLEVMHDIGAGARHEELAADAGISPATQRKRVQTIRERGLRALATKGFAVSGGFAALLASMITIFLRPADDGRVMAPRTAWDRAEEKRDEAAHACGEARWDDCEKLLDEAGPLDPAGERELDVRALRQEIAAARRAGARDAGAGAGKK
jgi:DNA-directed RNA polymerase specialized sigma24 family protein